MDPIKVKNLVEEFFLALAGMSEAGTPAEPAEPMHDDLLRVARVGTLRAYLDAEGDIGEARGEAGAGGTD